LHPLVYRFLIVSALTFLLLALIVMPFIKWGSPEFYANLLGIILLIIFIILVTIYHYKTKIPPELLEEVEEY
jgi:prepilin signal peptidase PulO-like enzyme (type II secretory pathway)